MCIDADEGPGIATRWAALHALGPMLLAAFANSPCLHGGTTGVDQWRSVRGLGRACGALAGAVRAAPERVDGPLGQDSPLTESHSWRGSSPAGSC